MNFNIDWDFIQELEGFSVKAYVPQFFNGIPIASSGVTVGTGFDLGQHNKDDLTRMKIPAELQGKLIPYLGLKREVAKRKLKEKPLTLTIEECKLLDRLVKSSKADFVAVLFDRDCKFSFFENLTKEQQTVICSLSFQYGNIKVRCPKFWKAVTTLKWEDAVKELRNFGDKYAKRRNKEADLLERNG